MEKERYAFLMVEYETPEIMQSIRDSVKGCDLYVSDDDEYGFPDNTHVTLAACLPNDVDIDMLKSFLRPIYEYAVLAVNVSKFDSNPEYDVLKFDVASDVLSDTNANITGAIPTYSEFKEYHPHATIAYVKKGTCESLKRDIITPLVVLRPKCFVVSYYDERDTMQTLRFS